MNHARFGESSKYMKAEKFDLVCMSERSFRKLVNESTACPRILATAFLEIFLLEVFDIWTHLVMSQNMTV